MRISLSDIVLGTSGGIINLSNLNTEDPHTAVFKRTITAYLSRKLGDYGLMSLGRLRGSITIDWHTPYSDDQFGVGNVEQYNLFTLYDRASRAASSKNHKYVDELIRLSILAYVQNKPEAAMST